MEREEHDFRIRQQLAKVLLQEVLRSLAWQRSDLATNQFVVDQIRRMTKRYEFVLFTKISPCRSPTATSRAAKLVLFASRNGRMLKIGSRLQGLTDLHSLLSGERVRRCGKSNDPFWIR